MKFETLYTVAAMAQSVVSRWNWVILVVFWVFNYPGSGSKFGTRVAVNIPTLWLRSLKMIDVLSTHIKEHCSVLVVRITEYMKIFRCNFMGVNP